MHVLALRHNPKSQYCAVAVIVGAAQLGEKMQREQRKCRIVKCNRFQHSAELCGTHYERSKRRGAPSLNTPIRQYEPHDWSVTVCEVDDCEKPRRYGRLVNGARMYLCSMHESRYARHGNFIGVRPQQ